MDAPARPPKGGIFEGRAAQQLITPPHQAIPLFYRANRRFNMTSDTSYHTISRRPPAWGYCRVSTQKQADESLSLARQADVIKAFARRHRFDLRAIEEEELSASSLPLSRRPGLVAVLTQARLGGGVIVVARADRLTRRVQDLPEIFAYGVPIHVVGVGRVDRSKLRRLIEKAASETASKSSAQVGAHKRAKRSRTGRCNIPAEASRRGRMASMHRRDDLVRTLAHFALSDPAYKGATWAERAKLLNAAGVLNITSQRTGGGKAWTVAALRAHRKRLEVEMALLSEEDPCLPV